MGQKTNIIEINGKKYDARTGDLLHPGHTVAPKPTHSVAVKKPAVHRQAGHQAQRHVQKSQTLVRHAVHKPATVKKIRVSSHTDSVAKKQVTAITVKKPARSLDLNRVHKANTTRKSQLITHFVPITALPGPSFQATPKSLQLPAFTTLAAKPVKTKAGKKQRTTADILDIAIQHATSHEQPHAKHKPRHKRHLKTAGLSAAAMLLLTGVAWYQLPNAQLQLASAKAGFNVSKPAYMPAGYSLDNVKYATGAAAVNFHSNSDSRQYTVAQKSSNWTSDDLLNNFVLQRDASYQQADVKGRTVYLYEQGNATWMKDGVWYVVQADGSLSRDQLLDMASSI